jgi:aminopeptidase
MPTTFEENLEKYADVCIRIGLGLRAGQRLLIKAPISAVPFVRLVTQKAYQAGARLVDVLWDDEQLQVIRLQNAPRDSFEEGRKWMPDLIAAFLARGDAFLSISSSDPELLRGQDPQLVSQVQRTTYKNAESYMDLIEGNASNWLVVAVPNPAWSAKVLPDVPADKREARMWELIFEMSRISHGDPVVGWQAHVEALDAHSKYLNEKQYSALKYSAPATDLTVGLPVGHRWESAGSTAKNGVFFIPNMPTEEVFTMPHKDKVDGFVTSTKPLNLAGTLIENFRLTFEAGRVVNMTAEKGEDALRSMLDTDEGARCLGEVALVPQSSPIARSGVIFFNTLYDENASSHIALGGAYNFTLNGGTEMSHDEFEAAGGNRSLIHADFMIGSDQMNIDGILSNGTIDPIMRGGEWAF